MRRRCLLVVLLGAVPLQLAFQKLLVVLDLDETLVHASLSTRFPGVPRLWQPKVDFEATGRNLILGVGEDVPLYVSLRPKAMDFVRWLKAQPIDVAVYTAGTKSYAKQTLRKLELESVRALYRDDCVPFGLPITKAGAVLASV